MDAAQFESLYARLGRIAQALELIADALDDVIDDGKVAVKGLIVTREDRP